MNQSIWFYLLALCLPVASYTGWLLGKQVASRKERNHFASLQKKLQQSISFISQHQDDNAIVALKNFDNNTLEGNFELKFVLANLYKNRGEVEKSIALHSEIIEFATDKETILRARFELANDYFRLGLFDRAEEHYFALRNTQYRTNSLKALLKIFHQEKDWHKAADICEQLVSYSKEYVYPLSQYYCELALEQKESSETQRYIKLALDRHPNCVRASVLWGNIERKSGNYANAIEYYKRVETQNREYLSEVIIPIAQCMVDLQQFDELLLWIKSLLNQYDDTRITAAIEKVSLDEQFRSKLDDVLHEYIEKNPSIWAIKYLLDRPIHERQLENFIPPLRSTLAKICQRTPSYRCTNCGFESRELVWNCPSCQKWETVKPNKLLI